MFQTSLLWQNDPRWAATALGYGPQTIKDWGCLTTSLTMVVNGCGYNETPPTVSQKMVNIGAFSGAAINAYRIGDAFPGVALANLVDCETTPAPLASIDAELANNKPVVVRVDQSPAPGIQDHWVVLYAKDGSDYRMWDPWRYAGDDIGKALDLMSRYTNSGSTPAQAITSVIFFNLSGKAPVASPTTPTAAAPVTSTPNTPPVKVALPANAVKVTPTVDQVAFRASGDITGLLIRRLGLGTILQSLEDSVTTQSKIGVTGQWLHVQAPEGDQGFVAAWYVSAASSGTTSNPTPPAAPATNLVVKVIQDQLALRSQPVIADTTLITRLALGTQLTLVDAASVALIGQVNQWVQVKTGSGQTGYVAAWYVSQ